jgi:hypothetical protein
MRWFAVYDEATGELVSIGTVVDRAALRPGLAVRDVGETAPADMWDAQARNFVPRPPKTTVTLRQALESDPDLAALTAAQRSRVVGVVKRVMSKLEIDLDEVRVRG